MGTYQDQVILVTGAGRTRGRRIAQAFAGQGAIVAANDLTPINLDNTIHQISAAGGRSKEYIFDIAKKMPVQGLLEQVLDDWGRLDILIQCAQVKPRAALLDMDEWDWRRTVDVNLSSVFFLLQSAGRIMRQQGHGRIVTLINMPDEDFNQIGFSAVHTSKTGLIGLILSAAQEFGSYGICVSGVVAGSYAHALRQVLPDQIVIPVAERSSKSDLGQEILFLCQAHPKAVNGKFLILEG
jgi:NAD(P)-dependent dehydrogenase (short-subunit alcohol dehydrogenase family)